jgi:aminopeptidase N
MLSTTHPICTVIDSTEQAESLFDGISYGKGASFLKQMFNIMGFESYKRGLQIYFQKHAWGNTTLEDFVSCMAIAYQEKGDKSMGEKFDFTEWCESWLNTSGINILEPQFSEEG